MKKVLIITLSLITVSGALVALTDNKVSLYIKDKIVQSKVPDNVTQTGAKPDPQDTDEMLATKELYSLLSLGRIETSSFKIVPIKKKRIIEVTIAEPRDENLKVFNDWMMLNGYGRIPNSKIIIK